MLAEYTEQLNEIVSSPSQISLIFIAHRDHISTRLLNASDCEDCVKHSGPSSSRQVFKKGITGICIFFLSSTQAHAL